MDVLDPALDWPGNEGTTDGAEEGSAEGARVVGKAEGDDRTTIDEDAEDAELEAEVAVGASDSQSSVVVVAGWRGPPVVVGGRA